MVDGDPVHNLYEPDKDDETCQDYSLSPDLPAEIYERSSSGYFADIEPSVTGHRNIIAWMIEFVLLDSFTKVYVGWLHAVIGDRRPGSGS